MSAVVHMQQDVISTQQDVPRPRSFLAALCAPGSCSLVFAFFCEPKDSTLWWQNRPSFDCRKGANAESLPMLAGRGSEETYTYPTLRYRQSFIDGQRVFEIRYSTFQKHL